MTALSTRVVWQRRCGVCSAKRLAFISRLYIPRMYLVSDSPTANLPYCMLDMLCFGLRWPTLTSARVALRCQGACWGRAFDGGGRIGCLGLGRAFSTTLITTIRAGITLGGCAAELEAAATEPLGNTFLGWITFGVCEGWHRLCMDWHMLCRGLRWPRTQVFSR